MGVLDLILPASEKHFSNHIGIELDPKMFNTLWITMKKDEASAVHNFSLPLLNELRELVNTIKENGPNWHSEGKVVPINYAVMRSEHPDYFSLGGDIQHFRHCIQQRDKEALYQYSRLCLDIIYDWATGSNSDMTTIALVQGRALGGGFETVLGADVVIAEEQSQFGFPEIMFGLFPCSGGMSLLTRRIGVYQAERMMTNARIYSAEEMKHMGLIDEICPRGEGNLAVENFIAGHAKRGLARKMLQRAKRRMAPLDYAEMLTVVEEWVEVALKLSEEELRVMDMLIKMQGGARKTPNIRAA
jgi:DSF synthase